VETSPTDEMHAAAVIAPPHDHLDQALSAAIDQARTVTPVGPA
jgi:hypothetical protein